ncbi:MAG TPA: FKBP-type peptidyl-prolyl cis-trans isomerase [Methanomicrobiales archaeon]|nr:FKBP-type peptidyl-prolyl cis-trans isomerase [Methanomicrobiales archaeon]
MGVTEGSFVRLSYTGKIGERVFDTTDEAVAKEAGIHNPQAVYGPILVRVGNRHVVMGLDDAIVGKEAGEEGSVEVPPEKAFGAHDDSRVESVPLAKFEEKPRIGMSVEVDNKEGTVVNIIGRRAVVDFNHPLAGKTATYTFRVESIVESQPEQIQGLIQLYTQRQMEVTAGDGVVTINLPPAVMYDRRWLLWRSRVIQEIFEFYPGIEEIVLRESFKRQAKTEGSAE